MPFTQIFFQDFINLGAKNVCVVTDQNLIDLPVMKMVMESLAKHKVNFKVFDKVRVEPTDIR